jgi:predicted transcriptional regulator
MKELSEIQLRRRIYILIQKNPGLHASKIAEILDVKGQLADYHLLYLERDGLVNAVKEEGYCRYYITGEISREDRQKLGILRQEIPIKIVLLLLKCRYLTHNELHDYFDIAASTLSYHLKKLVKNNIVTSEIVNKEKKYKLINEKEIENLLIKYKPYSWIDNFEDAWSDFNWK